MSEREIIIRGYFTTLEIEETEKGYGDGIARMEISKKTFEMICKDYDYGVVENDNERSV